MAVYVFESDLSQDAGAMMLSGRRVVAGRVVGRALLQG